ncbi:hypothetical protein BO71DRAFT_401949 [Aspergillus ellipticus CBS 707.79]|uniref:Uncharacterized protein n=1 Tax=Aspergillus ellipticus CBS 707.79 TaxID=1448320 RepID=A0A319CZS4_9EURO|nr:hypothetical protein BO71DRAFT_401949 [Aspergillus ellipticus CBS 707.79]
MPSPPSTLRQKSTSTTPLPTAHYSLPPIINPTSQFQQYLKFRGTGIPEPPRNCHGIATELPSTPSTTTPPVPVPPTLNHPILSSERSVLWGGAW